MTVRRVMTMERKDVIPILGQCLDGELHLLALYGMIGAHAAAGGRLDIQEKVTELIPDSAGNVASVYSIMRGLSKRQDKRRPEITFRDGLRQDLDLATSMLDWLVQKYSSALVSLESKASAYALINGIIGDKKRHWKVLEEIIDGLE
jgi:hypothetical protein